MLHIVQTKINYMPKYVICVIFGGCFFVRMYVIYVHLFSEDEYNVCYIHK